MIKMKYAHKQRIIVTESKMGRQTKNERQADRKGKSGGENKRLALCTSTKAKTS